MSEPVNGTDVMLYKHDVLTDTDIPFACARGCVFSINPTFIDVTNYTSANFKQIKPDMCEWGVSVDGLVIIDNYNFLFLSDLILSQESILIKFVVDCGADGLVIYAGEAFPGPFSITGNYNEVSTYSVQLVGTGAYNTTGTQVTPGGIVISGGVPTRYEYTVPSESTTITIISTIGASAILEFNRGSGNVTKIIYAGTPTGTEVKFTTSTGTFTAPADNPFLGTEEISGDYV